MGGLGHERCPVPERVVGTAGLWKRPVGLHLHGMDQVRKLDRVLNEKHRDIVAHKVPIAFFGVELHREASHVTWSVDGASAARDGRETSEEGCFLPFALEDVGSRNICKRFVNLEKAMRGRTAGMNDAFGDALVIEMKNLFTQYEIFEERRTACACS